MEDAIPLDETAGASVVGNSIGSARFSIFADTKPLEAGFARAKAGAKKASQEIGQAFGHGSNASMGLLYLGQAVDDVQYGFRAIVNNIPQITMALGGTAGIAGVVGIAAVAVNQLINHWDELKATLGNSEKIMEAVKVLEGLVHQMEQLDRSTGASDRLIKSLERVIPLVAMLKGGGNIMEWLGLGADARRAGRFQAAQKAEREAALKDIGKVTGTERQEQAKLFKEGVERYGGDKKLLDDLTERMMRSRQGMEPSVVRGMAALRIKAAMEGGAFGPQTFGLEFEKAYQVGLSIKEMEGQRKAKEAADKDQKEREEKIRKRIQEKVIDGLEDEKSVLEKRAKAIRERMEKQKDLKFERYGSTAEMMAGLQTSLFNEIPKSQLLELKKIGKGIDKLNEKMAIVRRQGAIFQ